MAEPVGDDTFSRGLEQARAALGRPARTRPRPVPEPVDADEGPTAAEDDLELDTEAHIAALEAENRDLRAALARVLDHARRALDD